MSKKKTTSGKYEGKRARKSPLGRILAVILVLLAVCMALILYFGRNSNKTPAATTAAQTTAGTESTTREEPTAMPEINADLGYGLCVTEIGSYTGAYMEDGTDEVLSNILMMIVKNDGEQDIQYAEIKLDLGDRQAEFMITTLPVGESIVLLEKNREPWSDAINYSAIMPRAENVAYFQEPMTTREDSLEIQIIDGALNVTNISGKDIPGTIKVYYKNAAEDLLYGGITYQITIEGGLKAGDIRQVMTNHASDTGSRIMFVTVSQ